MYSELPQASLTMMPEEAIERTRDMMDATFHIRKKNLCYLIVLQLTWNVILAYQGMIPINILNLPVLLGTFMLFVQGKNENLNLQRFAKILLFAALAKSVLIISVFFFFVKESMTYKSAYPNDQNKEILENLTMLLGINAAVDLVTAYLCLVVLRRTNEYINLINRKAFFEFRSIVDGNNNV